MLSARLVQLIEENWEQISDHLISKIRAHTDLPTLATFPDAALREWCQEILENLGHQLPRTKRDEARHQYQLMGRQRFEEAIPLHEAVLRLQMLKDEILDFIHQQGFAMTSIQLYAEEELERRTSRFFDARIYHLVRGYEGAMKTAVKVRMAG
jgi:hypothetical protein